MRHPAARYLELLNFYGITFVRLCTDDCNEVGRTVAMLVSAILGCRVSAVFLAQSSGEVCLAGSRGLPPEVVREWPPDSSFVRALWEQVERTALIRGSDLGPVPAAEARARGLGEQWLVAPLRDSTVGDDDRVGLILGADLREPADLELSRTVLDILSSFALSALASCRALSELAAANGALAAEVAERHRAEMHIRQLNLSLEQKVAERTSGLEAANRELEAFSYSVSHDLRAPLRSIDGFSQVLAEDYGARLGTEAKDYLQRIRRGAQRMGQLIDDLLHLSRMTRVPLCEQWVDLAMLVRETTETLRWGEPSREVEFVVAPKAPVRGDARLLRIAIENLIGNAWKFTRKHPRACIEFGVGFRDEQAVYFVRDDGDGFDPADAGKLFRPFQRLHSEGEFEGTGVGLSVVQRIVHRHGGRVWAEGCPGRGATFWFTLGQDSELTVEKGESRVRPNGPVG